MSGAEDEGRVEPRGRVPYLWQTRLLQRRTDAPFTD